MLAHGDEYDAVVIVTPHTSHVELGLRCAKLGKHILMDKPAGIDAGSVAELVCCCEGKRVSYGMIFQNRMLPAFRKAKELLESGALGTLHRAIWVCNNWYRSPAYHRSAGWRSTWTTECGGLMINQNPHYVDLWNWFFGLPDRVYAAMEFGRYNDFLVDDAVDIQFAYGSGLHGTMISATGEAPGVNRLEIWGSKGKLTVDEASRVFFDENELSTEEFGRVNEVKFAGIPHAMREIPLEEGENLYQQVLRNFGQHVLDGTPLYASSYDGLRQVQLANAVYVSGWEEKRVQVPVRDDRYCDGLRIRQKMEAER
jgi:predicted dehydrogenase